MLDLKINFESLHTSRVTTNFIRFCQNRLTHRYFPRTCYVPPVGILNWFTSFQNIYDFCSSWLMTSTKEFTPFHDHNTWSHHKFLAYVRIRVTDNTSYVGKRTERDQNRMSLQHLQSFIRKNNCWRMTNGNSHLAHGNDGKKLNSVFRPRENSKHCHRAFFLYRVFSCAVCVQVGFHLST